MAKPLYGPYTWREPVPVGRLRVESTLASVEKNLTPKRSRMF